MGWKDALRNWYQGRSRESGEVPSTRVGTDFPSTAVVAPVDIGTLTDRVACATRQLIFTFGATPEQLSRRPAPRIVIAGSNPDDVYNCGEYDSEDNKIIVTPQDTDKHSIATFIGYWLHDVVNPTLSEESPAPEGITPQQKAEAVSILRGAIAHYAGLTNTLLGSTYNNGLIPKARDRYWELDPNRQRGLFGKIQLPQIARDIHAMRIAEVLYHVDELNCFKKLARMNLDQANTYVRRKAGTDCDLFGKRGE